MKLSCYDPIDQVVYEEGTDYGSKGFVILRAKEARLVWRVGYTGWVSLGSTGYYPSRLSIEYPDKMKSSKYLHEGGRLSQALWSKYRPTIVLSLRLHEFQVPPFLPDRTITVRS